MQQDDALYDLPEEESLPAYLALCSATAGADVNDFSPSKEGLLLLSACTKQFDSSRTVVIAKYERMQ